MAILRRDRELSDAQLESFTGGYTFLNTYAEPRTWWEVIDDKTGEVLAKCDHSGKATKTASELGVSPEQIKWGRLREIKRNK